jgi:poly(3-hydroxybutyrate) depolymerase
VKSAQYRPRHVEIRSRLVTHPRLGIGVAALIALVAFSILAWGHDRSMSVVAAPVSRDGVSRTAPPRDSLPAVEGVGAESVAPAAPARPAPRVEPGSELVEGEYFVHIPPVLSDRMEVLVALHGMGGQGSEFCQALLSRSDRERWVVVAPTYAYGDWRDPNQVMREESSRFIPRLHEFLEGLPERTGLTLDTKASFYGFSRGAQLAQRFAMVYPEQTLGVAALSAGTYTLPMASTEVNGATVTLRYPFGTADVSERFGRPFDPAALRGIPFWIGVGANDRNPTDLPHQWDAFEGTTRVARAEAFAQRLREAGTPVQLTLFSGVDHAVTDEITRGALDFIAGLQ